MFSVRYSAVAQRSLIRHGNQAERLRGKINAYAANPESQANNVKRLTGTETARYRLRVGDFRVVFELDGDVMSVVTIGPRGGIYD